MELRSEEKQEKENKGKKIIIISIIILIALIILVAVALVILKNEENKKMKLIVDGKAKNLPNNFILTDSDSGIDYYPVETIARLTGYEFYNGEYNKYSEDKTKCYVECKDEIAMLELNSNTILKNNIDNKQNFNEYKVDNKIKSYGDSLYIAADGIKTAFNTVIQYRSQSNTISIYTLPYLVSTYNSSVKSYGYTGISNSFNAQKAITKDLIVVSKDGKYGVISKKDMTVVIGCKYDNIDYIEGTGEFIATSGGKTGTLSLTGETKIGLGYDEIGLIDSNTKTFYAKNNNLYGVLNENGRVLVYIQYDSIGINRSLFPRADIRNDKLLLGNCIPLKKDNKWGFADKNGNIIVNIEYDKLGYVEESFLRQYETGKNANNNIVETIEPSTQKSINNVIVISEIQGIVIGKNDKYGVVDKIGKVIIPCEYDKIYSITNEGKEEVYLEKDGRTTKLSKYIEENRIKVEENTTSYNNITNSTINNTTNDNSSTNNTVNNTTNSTITNTNNTKDNNEFVFVL